MTASYEQMLRTVLMLDGRRPASDALLPPDRLRNSYRWKPDQGTQLDLPAAQPWTPPKDRP